MFLPSPGNLDVLRFPQAGDGVRIDTGVSEGDTITPYYDPMIAKLICHGDDREQAISKMLAALESTHIEGIVSNVEFLRRAIAHPQFKAGDVFTGFIEAYRDDLIG